MLRRSLRLVFLGGLLSFAVESHAQALDAASQKPASVVVNLYCGRQKSNGNEALVIVKSTIIANGSLANMNPDDVKSTAIYKAQSAPAIFQGLVPNGVLMIEYARKVKSTSFAAVGRQLGLKGSLTFMLNGHELTARQVAKLRITPESIGQVHITPATSEVPQTTVNIEFAKS